MHIKRSISIFLFVIAISLLTINLIGLFSTLRNDEIYLEEDTLFENDINLTQDEVLYSLKQKSLDDLEFAVKANEVINKGIAHYWADEGVAKYNLRVPLVENYILHLSSYLYPSQFNKYQFYNYNKALERGVGLCSQHSIILWGFLNKNDIKSKIIGLNGHVVVTALVDKEKDIWWVLDPDYGVTIKHSLSDIEDNPELIRPYFSERGYDDKSIDKLVDIFGKEGNDVSDSIKAYSPKSFYFEKLSYVSIWALPILLLWLAYKFSRKVKQRPKA